MLVAVVIQKGEKSGFGASVPDLPGCFSAGRTVEQALANLRQQVELHVESLSDAGEPLPPLRSIAELETHAEYSGARLCLVEVHLRATD